MSKTNDDHNIQKIDLDKVDWRGSREFFESLGEALDKLDNKDESYDFTWVGKRKAIIEAGAPINKTFRPNVEASKDWESTENLFIEGDNLDALKLLQESYLGKVKMIYIDPPYNTGKDFVYHDDFKASVEDYDKDTEYRDEDGGIQFKKNDKTNGRYHSDWLSMMYPRLKLARNLLKEDGVIFISIDDNEHANLKKLCDEIFGEENLLSTQHIQVRYGNKSLNERKDFQELLETVLIYSKSNTEHGFNKPSKSYPIEKFNLEIVHSDEPSKQVTQNGRKVDVWLPGTYEIKKKEKGSIELFKETWISGSILSGTGHGLMYTKVIDARRAEDGDGCLYRIHGIGEDGLGYRYYTNPTSAEANRGKMLTKVPTNILEKVKSGEAKKESPIINYYDFSPDFGNIRHEGGIAFNSGKKPVKMLTHFLNYLKDKDFLVLDFFAGSSSTAHAVMKQNCTDGGTRKWIMVQLPENTDKKSEENKAGYRTISQLSLERIRRAGEKLKEDYKQDISKRETPLDAGFRALTVADTNHKEVHLPANEYQQAELLGNVDNIKEDRSDLDLLFGILSQSALEFNRPIEKRNIAGSDTYLYDYLEDTSGLIACFTEIVSEDTIKGIAKLKPLTAVFRDSSFKDSQAKVNLAEHFRIISPDTKVKVI